MINDLRVVDSQQIVDEYPCIVSEHHLRFCCCCCFVHSGQMDVSLELPCKYEIEMERKQQAAEELDPDANLHTCIYIYYMYVCACVFSVAKCKKGSSARLFGQSVHMYVLS